MIKEGQKIQRHDKTNLKKYRRQEEKTKDKDNNKREQRQKNNTDSVKTGNELRCS
jgi:hypothetical protein